MTEIQADRPALCRTTAPVYADADIEGRRDRKRLAGVAVVAATITAVSAGAASAQEGAAGFEIKDELVEVKAEGPGFETKLSPDGLRVEISDESFGSARPAS